MMRMIAALVAAFLLLFFVPALGLGQGGCLPWSQATSWPELGHVPTSSDVATIPQGRAVCLDTMQAQAGKLYVYGTLGKVDGVNVQLTMYGNLIVDQAGLVSLDSAADGSSWFIQFIVPTESQYIGGGNVPLDSDVGFWVTGAGSVYLRGAPKTSWTTLTGAATAGATSVTVADATGWHGGDEVAIAPTEPTSVSGFSTHFDVRTLSAVNGSTVTLSSGLAYPHPSVIVHGTTYTAEVMNLTRTGRIEGRFGLRTHFWVHNTSTPPVPHVLSYIAFRYLGPWGQGAFYGGDLVGTLGRWGGPHFHINNDFSTGTQVVGSVVRDFGSHAYNAHMSNGVTFQDDIAFNGYLDAYWYDITDASGTCIMGPNHTAYTHDIAAWILTNPSNRGYRLTGFFLGPGDNVPSPQSSNSIQNSVAVGVQGNKNASGFEWNETCDNGTWKFDTGNYSHDNNADGIFVWQNNSLLHDVVNFTAYYEGRAGIEHGAYTNCYSYQNATLYKNATAGVMNDAVSRSDCGTHTLQYVNLWIDAGTQDAFQFLHHTFGGGVYFTTPTLLDFTRAGIHMASDTGSATGGFADVDSSAGITGNPYYLDSAMQATDYLVDHGLHQILWRYDQTQKCANGSRNIAWNAWVCPQ
jgi:hypothetical protein